MKPLAPLSLGLALLLALATGRAAATQPYWIDHASRPGPDRPALGVSRFDELFFDPAAGYRIPYPFAALVEALATRIDNGAQGGVRQAIIPRGRSLQRDAAAPDHFRLPRVVIALEGEPATSAAQTGHVLEYRLFIAHQPATETLEVVSYNDAAGRFEFQVVDDYAAGKRPRVRLANRAMCLSCHHNAAPIFPRNPWSETNANVAVAKQLLTAAPARYGSLIGLVSNDPGVIDLLSERANYLSAAQFFWREGCITARCRAALLRAVLQYRLAAETSFDWHDPRFDADFARELERRFARRWPHGIALAGSRIPDRDPFAGGPRREHDPLMPRPPQATWRRVDSVLTRGLVYRLAGFFTRADIRRIDDALRADYQNHARRRHIARCRVVAIDGGVARVDCGDPAVADRLRARLEIDVGDGSALRVRVQSLQIPGDLNLWQPVVVATQRVAGGLSLELGAAGGLSLRLADGSRVSRFELGWDGDFTVGDISLEVELVREFEGLDAALDALLASHRRGQASSLAGGPFERRRLLDELSPALGMDAPRWPPSPRPVARAAASPPAPLDVSLSLLEPHCGQCHRLPGLNPPGFLAASGSRARIRRCAPRMLARLYAWQPQSRLPAAPMPPPATLADDGARWRQSDHYRELLALLEGMVEPVELAAIRAGRDYGGLPACRFDD